MSARGRHRRIRIAIPAAALLVFTLLPAHARAALQLSADGLTVYDPANNITWLANANTPAANRFGLPVCSGASINLQTCINPSGSMSYQAAATWVAAMNAANYLGHGNWQLPTTALTDNTCPLVGPNGGSFGYMCMGSALGSLFYIGLALQAPNTPVPIPNQPVGPFTNFQPYSYWAQSSTAQTFSFNSGYVGSNTQTDFLYVLPMIPGKLPGTPPATGAGLQVNPGGQTVYDPIANVTWLANANIAATNAFGLPPCKTFNTPRLCVAPDGAMNTGSAVQFVANMNTYNGTGYLGQTNWQLPPLDASCQEYNCTGASNPMGRLFYNQLGLTQGMPVVPTPDIAVGPFTNIQPYLYWSCQANTIQDPCSTTLPAPNFEWSFSFGSGFQGTDLFPNDLYVTAYFPGNRTSSPGPEIAEVANAEGESPTIAPNTWVEIKGVNLAPAGDSRTWQNSDFAGSQLPTALDRVSATVNGKNAYVYYISPAQINILTPPDAMSGPVQVVVTNNGAQAASFTAQAQPLSPSFFVFGGGPYVAAVHAAGGLIGPSTLFPNSSPAQPGESIQIYANGFGPTSVPVISGSLTQSGTLSPLPVVEIGGVKATVQYAGLSEVGEFQFDVLIPPTLPNGDQLITATYAGASTQAGVLITIHN